MLLNINTCTCIIETLEVYNFIYFFFKSGVFICWCELLASNTLNKWHANKQVEYVKITDIFINCSLVVKHEHFDIRIFEIRRKICGSIYMLIKRTYNCYTLLHTVVIFVLKKSSFKNVHDSKTFIQIAFQIKKYHTWVCAWIVVEENGTIKQFSWFSTECKMIAIKNGRLELNSESETL